MKVITSLTVMVALFFSLSTYAKPDCPSNYPNGMTLTYGDGSMNFPNGTTLRYSDGSMNYPNGTTLRYSDGAMNYSNGTTLRYSNGAMNYPNGTTLRYSDGSLNNPNGTTNQTGSVSLTTMFGDSQMRIVARAKSSFYQTSIAYGEGILILDFTDSGEFRCTVEGGNGPSEFRVEGTLGSAFVSVRFGEDSRKVKEAVQKALDGNL